MKTSYFQRSYTSEFLSEQQHFTLFSLIPLVFSCTTEQWKGGRVVEGTALEKRHTRKGIESSNLSLSAVSVANEEKEKAKFYPPSEGLGFRER